MARPTQLRADLARKAEAHRDVEAVCRPTAPAYRLLASAQRDGSLTVSNPRNNFSTTASAVTSR